MRYASWHVGMPLVCIREPKPLFSERWRPARPETGKTYTLREIFTEDRGGGDGHVFIRLVEIVNDAVLTKFGPYEAAFRSDLFRPIQTRRTDIGLFTAMLTGTKRKVPA